MTKKPSERIYELFTEWVQKLQSTDSEALELYAKSSVKAIIGYLDEIYQQKEESK